PGSHGSQRRESLARPGGARPAGFRSDDPGEGRSSEKGSPGSAAQGRAGGARGADRTGRSFLSYRRTRANEARLLIEAQHDIGIPTWQDLSELDDGHTDALLREA